MSYRKNILSSCGYGIALNSRLLSSELQTLFSIMNRNSKFIKYLNRQDNEFKILQRNVYAKNRKVKRFFANKKLIELQVDRS